MSEEAKVAYIQEKINEVKSREREAFVFFIIGLVLLFFAFDFFKDIIFQISSVLITIMGIALGLYYNLQKQKLMKQLRKMGDKEK